MSEVTAFIRGIHTISGHRRALLGSVTLVAGLTLTVMVCAFVRDLLAARAFGVGDILDAFIIAYLVPSLFINVVAASLTVSLVPTFVSTRKGQGNVAATRLLENVTFLTIVILIGCSAVLAWGFPVVLRVLAEHFSGEKRNLTFRLFLLVVPTITLGGLSSVWSGILNADNRFTLSAGIRVLPQLGAILGLVLAREQLGIASLAAGLLVGQFAETVILGFAMRRVGFSPLPSWHGLDAPTRKVLVQYAAMIAGAALMSSTNFVDQSMAAFLPPGSVAALTMGGKVSALLTGLGATAIGTVALPHFSQIVAERDFSGLRKGVSSYLRLILVVTLPLTTLIVVSSSDVIHVLFERGAFTSNNTALVSRILTMYAFQVPFYVCATLLMRVLSALGQNQQLMWVSLLLLGSNVALNLILMRSFGVAGLALSTSLVAIIGFVCCWRLFQRALSAVADRE